jgi:phosphatidylserine decarboxylase
MNTELHEDVLGRTADWMPKNKKAIDAWLVGIHKKVKKEMGTKKEPKLHPVMQEFKELIEDDPQLYMYFTQMFNQVPKFGKFKHNPIGGPEVKNYTEMIYMINHVLKTAPEFNTTDLVGFPINAILDWAMGTSAGFSAFLNTKVNKQFKKILNVWQKFLNSGESCYVLNSEPNGWMCKEAQKAIGIEQFQYDKKAPFWGFTSWNDFFIREFKKGQRPISHPKNDNVIVSACESTPYKLSKNVQLRDKFWIKSQPYSLTHMLDNSKYVKKFEGGTVYQAFLSAKNYHRWHMPVSGTIVDVKNIEGTYYSEAHSEHFDPAGPNDSQGYITQVATRALVYIKADNPKIGLMCFIAVGMAEVSTCKVFAKKGEHYKKGEQLGTFLFGGSTHCLIFRKGVDLDFSLNAIPDCNGSSNVVKINSQLAVVK